MRSINFELASRFTCCNMSGNVLIWSIYKGKGKKRLKICALELAGIYWFILLVVVSRTGCAGSWDRVIQKDWIIQDIILKRFNRFTNIKPRNSFASGARGQLSITAK